MNSTHALFNIPAREIGAKLKPLGSVCKPFWILTDFLAVEDLISYKLNIIDENYLG